MMFVECFPFVFSVQLVVVWRLFSACCRDVLCCAVLLLVPRALDLVCTLPSPSPSSPLLLSPPPLFSWCSTYSHSPPLSPSLLSTAAHPTAPDPPISAFQLGFPAHATPSPSLHIMSRRAMSSQVVPLRLIPCPLQVFLPVFSISIGVL